MQEGGEGREGGRRLFRLVQRPPPKKNTQKTQGPLSKDERAVTPGGGGGHSVWWAACKVGRELGECSSQKPPFFSRLSGVKGHRTLVGYGNPEQAASSPG